MMTSSLFDASLSFGGKKRKKVARCYGWGVQWMQDDSNAIIGQKFVHRQSRVISRLVMLEKPISFVLLFRFLLPPSSLLKIFLRHRGAFV
jgi:hypothetical protein